MLKLLFLFSCCIVAKVHKPDSDGWHRIRKNVQTSSFNFYVLGDWGGYPAPLYTTSVQQKVADSMIRTSKTYKPEFVLSLGDHFYYTGVEDILDKRWKNTFEDVYSSEAGIELK